MAVEKKLQTPKTEGILENVWANFICEDGHTNEKTIKKTSEVSKAWEELPSFATGRNDSMGFLQRLPSLGRWISMGAEEWDEILAGIVIPSEKLESTCETLSNGDVQVVENAMRMTQNDSPDPSTSSQGTDLTHKHQVKDCNTNKRVLREWEEVQEVVVMNGPPPLKRMETSEGSCWDDNIDVLEFEDLGAVENPKPMPGGKT
ncbi:integrase-type DNA-binding superfamily protein [Artemisia annua]|uniref:Integrase-type DNA-binding superfamily protein n=1 Tax=Artemisia annua TaxID=35608 RepID=A0A2U1KR79_ARTAN|nr:integrase-type DNA-binding superfamily protein [Artemisia annua]